MKIIYPAIFHSENNSYWVEFPDLKGCQSFGDTVEETFENAKEALTAYCVTILEQGNKLDKPRRIKTIKVDNSCFTSLIEVNIMNPKDYMKLPNDFVIKKITDESGK